MANINNEVLIRLKDTGDDGHIISAFNTSNSSEYLKMYHFCQKNDIPISFDDMESSEDIKGSIEDIEVFFGGHGNVSCIDVWINKW